MKPSPKRHETPRALLVTLAALVCWSALGGCAMSNEGDLTLNIELPEPGATYLPTVREGYRRLAENRVDRARETFAMVSRAVADDPYVVSLLVAGEGFCKDRLKEQDQGLADFEYALVVDGTNPDAAVGLARALVNRNGTGDAARAVTLLESIGADGADPFYTDRFGLGFTEDEIREVLARARLTPSPEGP